MVGFAILAVITATVRSLHEKHLRNEFEKNRCAQLERQEEIEELEDKIYWENRKRDKEQKSHETSELIHSEEVSLIRDALVAEARHTRSDEGSISYDEKWLVLRFYERLIFAHWEKPYIDYGQETIAALINEYQHNLIKGGLMKSESSETPVGPYVKNVNGLTQVAKEALNKEPAIKHKPEYWTEYIEREAYSGVPSDAADVWRQLAAEAVA